MPLPAPRAVLFDFGDTLLREGSTDLLAGVQAVLARATDTGGATAEEITADLTDLMGDVNPRRMNSWIEMPPHTVHKLVYEPRGVRFDIPQAEVEWTWWKAATMWTAEPGARDALGTLARRKIPCAVVSNTMFSGETIARQCAACGLDGVLQWVLTSAEHVLRKPHPRIFDLAARRLKLEPKHIWFVGDSYEYDVEGSAAAGMVPIWYVPRGDPELDPGRAAAIVRHWDEWSTLLESALA